ncbi:unnamed protein product [Staurois parvus]|uniref:Uncharacterized protein n=1 Tax=Staurois parvus TaxID=386267 RepID=A0ABN9H0Y6_9NEOB|nr:unnamed protein product [Staurois parvus]
MEPNSPKKIHLQFHYFKVSWIQKHQNRSEKEGPRQPHWL